MYCKHCGKQIADDSKFCQYCGGKQEELTSSTPSKEIFTGMSKEEKKKEKVVVIPTIKTNFSDKTKTWIAVYCLWTVLNAYWLFAGDKSSRAAEYFQPFSEKIDSSSDSYYDFSEFLVYVIGLPIAIWSIKLRKKTKNQNQKNSSDNPTPEAS